MLSRYPSYGWWLDRAKRKKLFWKVKLDPATDHIFLFDKEEIDNYPQENKEEDDKDSQEENDEDTDDIPQEDEDNDEDTDYEIFDHEIYA